MTDTLQRAQSHLLAESLRILPDRLTVDAIRALMATHGHTLSVEERAAVRGWLGRVG